MTRKMQAVISRLTNWGSTCGLSFNATKTVSVLFTRKRKLPPSDLVIGDCTIPFSENVTYLGVKLDRKLHWREHMSDKVDKGKRYLLKLANLTRKAWGPKPKLMRWAFTGVVRPMISYGALVWAHETDHMEKKFSRLNRLAISTFCSIPRSTPSKFLEIALNIMPLTLHCQKAVSYTHLTLPTIYSV